MQLSPDQERAVAVFKRGGNMFLTGPGGSGKTALIRIMVDLAKEAGKTIQVCAMTGCAAVLLGCPDSKTVHSWAGVGLAAAPIDKVVKKVSGSKHKRSEWNKPDILIVDEVSMMSAKLFEILETLGRKCRKRPSTPFGGLQVVFSGDFYQLPPIGDPEDLSGMSGAFCFEHPSWTETFPTTIQLGTIFRQTDQRYVRILNQIRVGRITRSTQDLLVERHLATKLEATRLAAAPDERRFKPTILLPRRRDVDAINAIELRKLEGPRATYKLSVEESLPIRESERASLPIFPHSPESREAEARHLQANIMAEQSIELVVGAQVLCVANIDMEGPYPIVNGSQGVVESFDKGLPMVAFNDGQRRLIGHHVWRSESIPGLGVKQIPLMHAWAITIHKAQGVSLDQAQIDAGSGIFECGQTYVALSRVRSLEGLHLTSFEPSKIKVNRRVQDFYKALGPAPRARAAAPPPAPAPVSAPAAAEQEHEALHEAEQELDLPG